MPNPPARRTSIAWLLFLGLMLVYNANGREMPTYDSQPTKFAARELALYGRLTLDRIISRAPAYQERSAFQRDLQGHYRSAYSIVPSIEAAVLASTLHVTGIVDLRAPLAPALVAALTASLLTAAAVALVFCAVARTSGTTTGVLVALGLGLGTNLWPLASRTLWQLETVSVGLALALDAWLRPAEDLRTRRLLAGGAGLALAGSARSQVVPMVVVLLAGLVVRIGFRRAVPALAVVAGAGAVLMGLNWYWFGTPLGATPLLQEQNLAVHGVTGTLNARPWAAAGGLLVSPNRGLLIFSPVVVVALTGIPLVWRQASLHGERWWTAAAVLQFLCYSCYSMWWGGHTYGPRYLVDLLVPLAPPAAAGVVWAGARRWRAVCAAGALAISIVVAGTGAFCYPHDEWNSDPEIDVNHTRLWDWHDLQIVRCWRRGPSPQNFSLFDRAAVRQSTPAGSRQ